jgi:hypothetical protein
MGSALLAVVLQHEIASRLPGAGAGGGALPTSPGVMTPAIVDALADAFASTFWWAIALSALALIPTGVLALTQRRERRAAADRPPVAV